MPRIDYRAYHPIPPLQPHEIRHLRETLGWSQAKLGQFLSRDTATISRWESGAYDPDPLSSGVLYRIWIQVFGAYDGPYPDPSAHAPQQADDVLQQMGKALLIGGAAYFIVKGLGLLDDED